jgi:uncharacterized membrane protein
MMDPRETLLILVRWFHAAGAVVLVGGSAFYLLVLAPSLAQHGEAAESLRKSADSRFRELLDLSAFVLLVSGGLLFFDRLAGGAANTLYVAILALKVLLSLLVYRQALVVRRGAGWQSGEAILMVGGGFLVVLLATVLKTIYEAGLRAA